MEYVIPCGHHQASVTAVDGEAVRYGHFGIGFFDLKFTITQYYMTDSEILTVFIFPKEFESKISAQKKLLTKPKKISILKNSLGDFWSAKNYI